MNNDSTTCCRTKPARLREVSKAKKRTREASDDSSGETSSTRSGTSERRKQKPLPKKQKMQVTKVTQSDSTKLPAPKKISPSPQIIETMPDLSAFCSAELGDDGSAANEETVCAPDLFEFLSNRSASMSGTEPEPEPVTPTSIAPPPTEIANANPAPIVIQNVLSGNAAQRNINSMGGSSKNASPSSRMVNRPNSVTRVSSNTIRVNATPTTTEPVYHVINGYKIDLNSAAQQNTIRLPNGKIIHVKKQPVLPNGPPGRQPISRLPARPAVQQVRNPHVPQQQMQRPPPPLARQMSAIRQQAPAPRANPRGRPNIQVPSASAVLQSMHAMQSMQTAQAMQSAQALQQAMQQQPQQQLHPSVIAQQNKNSIVAAGPRKYHGGPVGNARTQFERQIFNGLEICQHIESKLKTLMNSNAYKNVRNVNDIKELQIHMSYLLTFTLGRFKTLQDKCMDDMRKLGFQSEADSLSEGNVIKKYGSDNDEDDIEIVEPQHATINLDDSDDEQPKKTPEKNNGTTSKKKTTVTPPSHLASAIAAAQSLVAQMAAPRTPQIRISPIARIERTPQIARTLQTIATHIEPGVMILESNADTSTEDVECEVDIMAMLQPQVILNDHDELELPMPPPLTPPSSNDIPDDPKLKGKAQVRLKKADDEFPELMYILNKRCESGREGEPNEAEVATKSKSKNSSIEVDSDNDAADNSVEMVDDVVADYENAIHRLQELSSEICTSPTSTTSASAQAERTEADNTIDEFVSVLEISYSSNKSSEAEKSAEPMDTDDIMSILDLPEEIIAATDETSTKTTIEAKDSTNDDVNISAYSDCVDLTVLADAGGKNKSRIEKTNKNELAERETNATTDETSNGLQEDTANSKKSKKSDESKVGELEETPNGKENEENEREGTDEEPQNKEKNDQVANELPITIGNSKDNDAEVSSDVNTSLDSTIPTEEQSTTLNECNDSSDTKEDNFENISSPDTFDDYSKNGVAGKNDDSDIFDDAIDDLICGNISAIAN